MHETARGAIEAVLHATPHRFAMPTLPPDAAAAQALGPSAALVWAMEQARRAASGGGAPEVDGEAVFVQALIALVDAALRPVAGDAAFQARVLQARSASVAAHVQLSASSAADRRQVRAAVNAWAHPAKLRALPADLQGALRALHEAMQAGAWMRLGQALDRPAVPAPLRQDGSVRAAIERLAQAERLLDDEDVRRFEGLRARQAPGGAATATERGQAAEQSAAEAFVALAAFIHARLPPDSPRLRVVTRLLLPAGFPGEPARSKNEWDVALVEDAGAASAGLHLLAEVKASPEAAASDLPTLLRGLQRLGQADAEAVYPLPSDDGVVVLQGRSLRAFEPCAHALPPQVLYLSTAAAEPSPPWLDAAARGLLLSQPQVIEFALQRESGRGHADDAPLRALWAALPHDRRLRSLLHHHDTARHVRAAMLHPADLRAAVQRLSASAAGAVD
jgi:hypothetical protein